MKLKKKQLIYMIVIAVLLLFVAGVLLVKGKSLEPSFVEKDDTNSRITEDSKFKKVTDETVSLENDTYTFTLDTKTSHFIIVNKKTGESYNSTTPLESDINADGLYTSEIAVDYFDTDSIQRTMYSTTNSVVYESFEIKATENAIRVYYDIRESKEEIFVPPLFNKEVFEEEILGKLGAGQKRRIARYYKLRNAEDNSDLLSTYPELRKQELYIVVDTLSEKDNVEITTYFKQAGYTAEQYKKDTEGMEVPDVTTNLPAQFYIPVEYKLTENGFAAEILNELISSKSDNYTLAEVHLLPMFGSVEIQNEGYLFVPDGSGGIISMNDKTDGSYNVRVYGNDTSVDKQLTTQVTQRSVMPVFGMNRVNNGFFAIIEGAAENATVRSQVLGTANLSSAIHASFLMYTYDTTNIAEYSAMSAFNLYSKECISENPSVRYLLLEQNDCDYSAMAKHYQKYLLEKGILNNKLEDGTALYLDFTGYITEEATLLGVSYDAKMILSNLQNIHKTLNSLYEENVTDMSVRLKAYSHGGMTNSVMDSFALDGSVGSKTELQELKEKLTEHNGILYLDNVVDVVYRDNLFDSFSKLTHSSRKANQMLVERGDYDIVRKNATQLIGPTYLRVSPIYYGSVIDGFVTSFSKAIGETKNYGYSWSGYGCDLGSDYNESDNIDRIEGRKLAEDAISKAGVFSTIMTEGGNMYAVAQADTILNTPLTDSSYRIITESVPFYQMVLHGYKNYSGAPLNIVTDSETEWLKTIESGASMYYSCMTEDYTLIKDMNYRQTIYPISEELCHDEIVNRYQIYSKVFEKVSKETIERHEIIDTGLHLTTYEDGTIIAVNYQDYPIEWNNITVEAKNFAVSQ